MALSRPGSSYSQPSTTVPGASGGGTESQGVNASAGSDVQTDSTDAQVLSGSASNGTAPYSYAWTLRTRPSGSSASISGASSATASLDGIDEGGAYVCSVQATDANGFTDSAQVCIDYSSGAGAAAWTDIVNITFASLSTVSLTDGQENTVDGHTFWLDGLSGTGTAEIVNGSGLEFTFPNQSGQFAVFLFKGLSVTKNAGQFPRFRVVASFSDIVYSQNSDTVGLWLCGQPYSGSQQVPVLKHQYKRNSASAFVYKCAVRSGTLGASGSDVKASDVATSESNSIVLGLMEGEGSLWEWRAEEGTTTINAAGVDTVRASGVQPGSTMATSDTEYWAQGGSNTGPYLGVFFRSNSNGSQFAKLRQLVIQTLG